MNKSGKVDIATTIVICLIAIAVLQITGMYDFGKIKGAVGGVEAVPSTGAVSQTGQCLTSDKTTYTYTIDDKYVSGSAVTSAADNEVRIFVDGIMKDGAYTHSGDSLTLAPNQKVEQYLIDLGEDNLMTSANTIKAEFTVPCSGVLDKSFDVTDLITGGADGTATVSLNIMSDMYKDISQSIAGDGNEWALSAGSSKVGTFKMTGVSKKGWGAEASSLCIVYAGNKSEFDTVALTGTSFKDVDCKPVGHVPVDTDEQTWDFTASAMDSVVTYDGMLSVLMESGASGAAANGNLTVKIYDQQYFLDKKTGKVALGYEDEDHNLIGAPEVTDVVNTI